MKHKKDGLESKVFKFRPNQISRDATGHRYIPYCDFQWHMGLIQDESVCEARECSHYHRLYISKATKYFSTKYY